MAHGHGVSMVHARGQAMAVFQLWPMAVVRTVACVCGSAMTCGCGQLWPMAVAQLWPVAVAQPWPGLFVHWLHGASWPILLTICVMAWPAQRPPHFLLALSCDRVDAGLGTPLGTVSKFLTEVPGTLVRNFLKSSGNFGSGSFFQLLY